MQYCLGPPLYLHTEIMSINLVQLWDDNRSISCFIITEICPTSSLNTQRIDSEIAPQRSGGSTTSLQNTLTYKIRFIPLMPLIETKSLYQVFQILFLKAGNQASFTFK